MGSGRLFANRRRKWVTIKLKPPEWDPGEYVRPLHPWEINPELSVEQLLGLPKEVQQALKGQPLEFDKSELKREDPASFLP